MSYFQCMLCGKQAAYRHSYRKTSYRGLFDQTVDVKFDYCYCTKCRKFYRDIPITECVINKRHYANEVIAVALEVMIQRGKTLEATSRIMRKEYNVRVPPTTLHDWYVEFVKEGVLMTRRVNHEEITTGEGADGGGGLSDCVQHGVLLLNERYDRARKHEARKRADGEDYSRGSEEATSAEPQ